MNSYWVYILCSNKNGILYVGVTSNLARRIQEHQNKTVPGFTQKYNVHTLVHAEKYSNPRSAIVREKCIKRWNRAWKIQLIEQINPEWQDLSKHLL